MRIVIVGCGRVGSSLARRFVEAGHTVSIVDKNRAAFQRLGENFQGRTVQGLGFDEEVLHRAGIDTADALLAFTAGDNSNLMIAQIAQDKYRISSVYARVKDPLRAEVYRDLGLNVFCTTLLNGNILEDAMLGRPFRSAEEYLCLSMLNCIPDAAPTSLGRAASPPQQDSSAPTDSPAEDRR
ncbi:MAG: TrkA family potassium uptake protein [Armatimonadetes bacterium]|nr:TrkA family potassium uptake protein [Armatimonadota bacterium]